MLCFFFGIGLGNGRMVSERLSDNTPKFDYYLTNLENSKKPIQLIGTTSSYILYLEKDNNFVQVSPVQNIRLLEALNKKERKALYEKLNPE